MSTNTTAIAALASHSDAVVEYTGAKNATKTITATAAIVVGGKALSSLKSMAATVAVRQAEAGRYRAAAEILADAFPKVAKGFADYVGSPFASKAAMGLFVQKVQEAQPGAKGWTKKQLAARAILADLVPVVAPELAAGAAETIEASEATE